MPRNKRARSDAESTGPGDRSPIADAAWRDATWRARFRRRLLSWFDRNQRSLPWRQTTDPYLVWISEVMLQQTQVATVIPYFERFRERFPTPRALAEADEAEVLRLWEGLGYYRRARQLHAAAKVIVEQHDGHFPDDFAQVLALPGIGRYTAGAVLSIAQDQRHPIVEANTQRLYSRVMALQQPLTEKRAANLLWEFATAVLPRNQAGRLNQAMMELGALVCTPREPKCPACPLRPLCSAHQQGLEAVIPGKVKKLVYEERAEFALLIRQRTATVDHPPTYFVYQVPEGRRWAGLWDFPRYGGDEASDPHEAAQRVWAEFGIDLTLGARLATIRHGVTRYRITLDAYHADQRPSRRRDAAPASEAPSTATGRWLTAEELGNLPLSVTGRQLAERLLAGDR